MTDIQGRFLKLKQSVATLRPAQDVTVLLVTKTVEPARILEAYQMGARDFGENRVQELLEKKRALPPDIRWHMIGHLQTNKVKQILGEVELIHSLDRAELAEEINRVAALKKIEHVDCLIQVNVSGEATKFGMAPEAVPGFVRGLKKGSAIRLRGLMTIGPLTEDPDKIRRVFRILKDLERQLRADFPQEDWGLLSMGMSGDYRIALEEGANLIRIGTAVFGERNVGGALR